MSYYILTLASNLGNILSTESISPASLYAKRSYGFRFFETGEKEGNPDLMRLFGDMPTVPDNRDEDIVMALELDESLVKHPLGNGDELWTAETIRIAPSKCRFVFYSVEDLGEAFNRVQRSIEAKFSNRYREKARVKKPKKPDATLFDALGSERPGDMVVKPESIARFERLDRMKGAIFGYCLGFCYSLPKDNAVRDDFVEYLRIVDKMVNSVTQTSSVDMEGYRRSLEYILFRFGLNAMARQLKPIRQLKPSELEAFDLSSELARLCTASSVEPPFGDRNDSFALNMYRTDLEDRIHKAKDSWKSPSRFTSKPTVADSENGPVLHLPEKDGNLASGLINHLIRADVLGKTKRSLGYPFALECGKLVRGRVGDRWENSGERAYINRLLPHLNNMEEFDSDNNPGIEDEQSFEVLRALALLCERQDNEELDSFYRYLLAKCHVADLCLPFALWGAAFGFSAMPKTLCDSMSKATEATARSLFDDVLAMLEK